MGIVTPLSQIGALMPTKEFRFSAAIRGRVFRVVSIFAAAIAIAACGSKNAYVPPPPPKVIVAQPLQQPVTSYLELTGNTAPINSVDLVARVQGFLESINYADGAVVTKGTQLFGIERDIYQQQLDQAKATLAANEATLEYNTAEYKRQEALARQDFASQSIMQQWKANQDSAAAQVLSAKAAIELANINLGYTDVQAPFDGIVTNHLVDLGALVGFSGPTKLATIIQAAPLYVYFTMSEPQILALQRNLAQHGISLRTSDLSDVPVEIGLAGEDGYPHKGHMDYASPQVDFATGTLTARALFENKDHALLPGLFVRVRTPIAHQDKALLTRDDALGTSQEGSYVLVVNADNVVERRVVKTGVRQGQLRIIESGLDPGDWVVTEGTQRAFPGAKVDPQRTSLAPPAAEPANSGKASAADQDSAPAAPSQPAKPAATGPAK
jgi:membrane fusion protein, multidrug efflux system